MFLFMSVPFLRRRPGSRDPLSPTYVGPGSQGRIGGEGDRVGLRGGTDGFRPGADGRC